MRILSGNSNRPLADAICAYCNLPQTRATIRRFSDDEVFVEINENVRGEDVFLVQSTSYPANDNMMELLLSLIHISEPTDRTRSRMPSSA